MCLTRYKKSLYNKNGWQEAEGIGLGLGGGRLAAGNLVILQHLVAPVLQPQALLVRFLTVKVPAVSGEAR